MQVIDANYGIHQGITSMKDAILTVIYKTNNNTTRGLSTINELTRTVVLITLAVQRKVEGRTYVE